MFGVFKKRGLSTILFLLLSLMLLGGCGGSDSTGPLSAWTGGWRTMASYLDDPLVHAACEKVADAAPGFGAGGVLQFLKNMYRCDFSAMEILGDAVIFFDKEGTELETVVYRSAGTAPIMGYEDNDWCLFEAVAQPEKGCRYLAATEVHGGDEGMGHWHFRCGDGGFEAIVGGGADPFWWPTAVADDTTAQTVADDILSEIDVYVSMLGEPLSRWKGTWVSVASFLDDPAMSEAYDAVAAEARAAGKSYDAASVKAFLKSMFETPFASVVVEGDVLSFFDASGAALARVPVSYEGQVAMVGYDGYYWEHFQARKAVAGYGRLLVTAVHSDGEDAMAHWHLRFGDGTAEDLARGLDKGPLWFPTCTGSETTAAVFAQDVVDEAAVYAQMLP